jgi:hypothetical protein
MSPFIQLSKIVMEGIHSLDHKRKYSWKRIQKQVLGNKWFMRAI